MMPVQIKDTTLYSVPEISQMLHLTPTTIRNYLKKGKLRGHKIDNRWIIAYEDLSGFIKGF